jgi:hypothetical protein
VPKKCLRFHGVHFVCASRTNKKKKDIHGSNKGLGRFRATFDETLDCEQVGHLKLLESRLFGLTYTEVRQLAYQLAEKSGIERGLNCQKMAGWDRIVGFKRTEILLLT